MATLQQKVNQLYGTIEWQNAMLKALQKWETAASQAVKYKYSIFPPKLPQLSDYLARTWFKSQTKPVSVKVQAPPKVTITSVPKVTVKPEHVQKYAMKKISETHKTSSVAEAGILGKVNKAALIAAGLGIMLFIGHEHHKERR